MGGEAKPGRGLRSWAQRHLNAGFAAGFLLVLLTYLVVSQQFAVTAPNAVATKGSRIADKQVIGGAGDEEVDKKREQEWQPKTAAAEEPDKKDTSGAVQTEESPKRDDADAKPFEMDRVVCNTDGPVSETCDLDGDVRINGSALSVTFVPSSASERREWRVRPYSRRTMTGVDRVTVTRLRSPQDAAPPPPCAVTHDAPAVLFALGGLTGNYWHDFSDVLVPLFAASRRYGGEVLFLVSNIQPWWLGKYEAVVRRLSRHDAVDLDRDAQVRCFRHLTVGLRLHKELSIVPELAPGGQRLTMADFTAFLRETYALPRAAPVSLAREPGRKPRLLLIHRAHYRRFENVPEIKQAAEAAGFEVTVASPRADAPLEETARAVNSHDVLLGVHGAGLTNAVFLPPGAVVIQVVPYGKLERMARTDFGEPVADMGLRYLEYSVAAEESTLLEMLGPEHPVIKDPESIHRSGWDKVAEYYLGKQDVRIDVNRFAPTLAQAIDHLRRQR
ncbi:beta-1,2-xylosyltransferase XYXT1-like isoform X1 [Panicum virgatum]|uniref:Glycosyltransferase 61 catalytic domain-containing protein n=1 Tax=Panicum virgatum TaxID=38727 RepID=A0A8T0RS05_PANVG|nr:beta-1,2-xylosyltransferase XYXT1-like isoform X1 [Panicum virgatum]KAG2587323.1 hypothetical protein PVAP13_5NG134400 [Panicum virgatum]